MYSDFDSNRSFVQNMFFELKKRVEEQGITSYDEYVDMVEEIVEEKVEDGVLTVDEDLRQVQQDLQMMWPELHRDGDDMNYDEE